MMQTWWEHLWSMQGSYVVCQPCWNLSFIQTAWTISTSLPFRHSHTISPGLWPAKKNESLRPGTILHTPFPLAFFKEILALYKPNDLLVILELLAKQNGSIWRGCRKLWSCRSPPSLKVLGLRRGHIKDRLITPVIKSSPVGIKLCLAENIRLTSWLMTALSQPALMIPAQLPKQSRLLFKIQSSWFCYHSSNPMDESSFYDTLGLFFFLICAKINGKITANIHSMHQSSQTCGSQLPLLLPHKPVKGWWRALLCSHLCSPC